ncbi:MAG: hypothetical protein HZB13_10100 [Acidobacteria bacterium]|nr:hypothetical protein [Acidobacteriota bacterium]
MERVLCHLCESRPPRRQCPALGRDICAPCCGQEREHTIDCPLECEHLRDARQHEKAPEVDPKSLPNPEIELTDKFMQEKQPLAIVTGRLLLVAALETPGAVDLDMRDALDALVRTYKTADSGLVYESRPANAIAAAVGQRFQDEVRQFREHVAQQSGVHTVSDKDLMGVLVFWQRMEWQRNNGRRKGRAFIESLFSLMPPPQQQQDGALVSD